MLLSPATIGAIQQDPIRRIFKQASLDLRFADNKSLVDAVTGASLVTFTRASTGTFVGSDGLLRSAVTNLLLRSEEFDNASWTKSAASITANNTTAPDGASTADKLVESATNAVHFAEQIPTLANTTTHVCSVYAKAAERTSLYIWLADAGWGTASPGAFFNLTTGTVTSSVGTVAATITPVGNGWYRCAVGDITAVSGTRRVRIATAVGGTASYTGDGTSGIYLWGAQLEQSTTVGEYIPTTSVINSAPRFDHNPTTGESLGLLLEEARTNVLLNSATLSTQSVTVAAVANTLSFYGTGTVTLTGVSTAGPLVGTVANNRVSLTFTPTVGVLILTVSGSVTNAQLEAGAFATSYIPTTTAAATRAADVASITGAAFTSFYNQSEGVMFANGDFVALGATSFSRIIGFTGANTGTDEISLYTRVNIGSGDGTVFGAVTVNSSLEGDLNAPIGSPNLSSAYRSAIAYKANNFGLSSNGLTPTADTSGSLPTITQLIIMGNIRFQNRLSGHIRRLTFWPTRLSNEVLQRITQ